MSTEQAHNPHLKPGTEADHNLATRKMNMPLDGDGDNDSMIPDNDADDKKR